MTSALLLGDANSVYVDADAALKMFTPDLFAATNNIGVSWEGRIDHWFTLHTLPAEHWVGIDLAVDRRVREGRNRPTVWAFRPCKTSDNVREDWQGATGLFAVKGLLEIGCNAIVLAGVPMNKVGAHYYDVHEWIQADKYHKGWHSHFDEIAPFVRSMSGWTRELLGPVTPEWLEAQTELAVPAT